MAKKTILDFEMKKGEFFPDWHNAQMKQREAVGVDMILVGDSVATPIGLRYHVTVAWKTCLHCRRGVPPTHS